MVNLAFCHVLVLDFFLWKKGRSWVLNGWNHWFARLKQKKYIYFIECLCYIFNLQNNVRASGQPASVIPDTIAKKTKTQIVKEGPVPTTLWYTDLMQVHSVWMNLHVHAYLSLMQFVQPDLQRPGKPDVDGHKSAWLWNRGTHEHLYTHTHTHTHTHTRAHTKSKPICVTHKKTEARPGHVRVQTHTYSHRRVHTHTWNIGTVTAPLNRLPKVPTKFTGSSSHFKSSP